MPAIMATFSTLVRRAHTGLPAAWPQLRQAIQTAFAAVVAYAIAAWFALPQNYWAVMTAILVVQASIGASLGLALDRLLATLLGAAVGAALVALFGTAHLVAAASLFVAVLLLAFLASRRASLRLAPVTAAIVILSDPSHGEPVMAAAHRVIEIGLGSLVALATTLLLFPSRAGTALA
ncbi:MAG: FUSC family protein, partial [Dongiaceae bacterium]